MKSHFRIAFIVFLLCGLGGCASSEEKASVSETEPANFDGGPRLAFSDGGTGARDPRFAHVLDARIEGGTASVTLQSPDQGCAQYANWWEVVRPDGSLVYRRVLGHSHVDEQPFTRSGGPVIVGLNEEVLIRAHMHPQGYGGDVLRGSANGGFVVDRSITRTFASELAVETPLPTGCAF